MSGGKLSTWKPRIKRFGPRWICSKNAAPSLDLFVGFGDTPFLAYFDWLERCRPSIRDAIRRTMGESSNPVETRDRPLLPRSVHRRADHRSA